MPTAILGDSAAETLILMLDHDAEFVLVVDRAGELRGVVTPRDFTVSATTSGVSLHEQVRRAGNGDRAPGAAGRVPAMLGELLSRQLASGKVITGIRPSWTRSSAGRSC